MNNGFYTREEIKFAYYKNETGGDSVAVITLGECVGEAILLSGSEADDFYYDIIRRIKKSSDEES